MRMSTSPNSSTAFLTNSSGTPGSVRSPEKTAVSPSISEAACSATSPSMSLMRTRAPSATKSSAVARPMPRAEPVMIAFFPSSSPMCRSILLIGCRDAPPNGGARSRCWSFPIEAGKVLDRLETSARGHAKSKRPRPADRGDNQGVDDFMNHRTLLATACAVIAAAFAPAIASADDGAEIHPGVMTFTEGAQCTSNFVFRDGAGTYLGQAAHCSGTGAATDTDGCDADTLPLGTPVEVDGASRPGTLAYSSWVTMQANGETNENACAYNDFALVKLDPTDVAKVDPTVPRLGRPTSV